jgi:hypothetical protein
VDYVIKNKPDLFLIAGDVFDKISPTNAARVFLTQQIRRIKEANISTFITNDPRTLPDEVYTLLDNLVAFMFKNEDELRQLAKSGLIDTKSI